MVKDEVPRDPTVVGPIPRFPLTFQLARAAESLLKRTMRLCGLPQRPNERTMNWGSPHRISYFRAAHGGCWVSLDHFGDVHGSPGKQRFGHGRLLRFFTQLVTLRVTPRCGEIGDSFNISLQGSAQLSVIPLLRNCFLRDSHWSHLHHSHQTKEVESCKTTQLIITTPATILPKVMLKMLETRFTPNFNRFIVMCAILNGNCQGANPQFLSTNSLTNHLETD